MLHTTSAFISVFFPHPIILGFLSPGNMIVVFLPVFSDEPETQLVLTPARVEGVVDSAGGYCELELLL